ncbi:polyprenyl synthetase family protein [soil metagenome]
MSASLTGGSSAAIDLAAFLAREQEEVERALATITEQLLPTLSLTLREPVGYALGTRGKRLRPILCCAACRAVGGNPPGEAIYRLSCALEIVHTYSLVHDDLPCMDDDDLRRGRPTVHRVYGAPLATLAGAALLPIAAELLEAEASALGLAAADSGRLVAELCAAAGAEGMVGGQLLDLEAEARPVDRAGLEAIHRSKTGALLAVSLRLGALAAGAGERETEALTACGRALGLAFQIADDILDVTGNSAALGKTAGRDQSLGKATYPALHGLEGARALARAKADEAVAALRGAGIASPELEALALHVVERRQ